jgi:hypothetical protein
MVHPKKKKEKKGSLLPLFSLRPWWLDGLYLSLCFASRLLFAQLSPATLLTWLLIVLASPQFFVHPAAFNQFLEPA